MVTVGLSKMILVCFWNIMQIFGGAETNDKTYQGSRDSSRDPSGFVIS
jgi:hypothetical protein